MAKTIQISLPSNEVYESLRKQAMAEGMSLSEYGLRLLRMGEIAETLVSMKTFDEARREVDLSLQRQMFTQVARSVMLLEEISERLSKQSEITGTIKGAEFGDAKVVLSNPGIGVTEAVLAYIREDAIDAATNAFQDIDYVEKQADNYIKAVAGEPVSDAAND